MAINKEDHFDDQDNFDLPDEEQDDDVLVEDSDDVYTTKDLADATIDLLNSDSMNWDNGVYEKREEALDNIGDFLDANNLYDTPNGISEEDWSRIVEDGEYDYLEEFMINNPQYAEDIFNVTAKVFGFSNYKDYSSYSDWVDFDDGFEEDDEFFEATNAGAVTTGPVSGRTTIVLDNDEELDELVDDVDGDLEEAKMRVWYHPTDYPDEEDYIDIDSDDDDEAIRQARSLGSVSSIEDLEESYHEDESQPFYVEYWVSDIDSSFSHGMPHPTLYKDIIYAYDEEQVQQLIEDDVWEMGKDYWLEDIKEIRPATQDDIDSVQGTSNWDSVDWPEELPFSPFESYKKEAVTDTDTITSIDIDSIDPFEKDWNRADGLRWRGSTFKGNGDPFASNASKMAKSIKDPWKMVRRAMAVYATYGTHYGPNNTGYYKAHYIDPRDEDREVFEPFRVAMMNMGFTNDQIRALIKKASKLDNPYK